MLDANILQEVFGGWGGYVYTKTLLQRVKSLHFLKGLYSCVNRLSVTLANRDEADLWVGEHLLDGVNRATGDSGALETSQPLSCRLLRKPECVRERERESNECMLQV